jgi:hypothetical protein
MRTTRTTLHASEKGLRFIAGWGPAQAPEWLCWGACSKGRNSDQASTNWICRNGQPERYTQGAVVWVNPDGALGAVRILNATFWIARYSEVGSLNSIGRTSAHKVPFPENGVWVS